MEQQFPDTGALAENMIKLYSHMVYRLAYSMVNNSFDADDIHQEVFIRYLKRRPLFQNSENEKAWFLRVTINCCKNHWKSAWMRKVIGFGDNELPASFELEPEDRSLIETVKTLPEKYRVVIHLFYYEDMSIDTISKVTGRKLSTIRTQLTRARKMLKKDWRKAMFGNNYKKAYNKIKPDQSHVAQLLAKAGEKISAFDSYELKSYTSNSHIGGSSFLGYDSETQKAYFLISVQAETPFDKNKLTFYANRLLCGITAKESNIDLSAIKYKANTKSVIISGSGGSGDISKYSDILIGEKEEGNPRRAFRVLSPPDMAACKADDFTVTGTAYEDDLLRVQICMGYNAKADRHVQPFLVSSEGMEQHEDYSVSWSETIEGVEYTYYEYWFFGPFQNLEDYKMYGIFHNATELIEGEWNVTFRMEP